MHVLPRITALMGLILGIVIRLVEKEGKAYGLSWYLFVLSIKDSAVFVSLDYGLLSSNQVIMCFQAWILLKTSNQ